MVPFFCKFALIGCLAFLSPALAVATEAWDGPREGVLVLRNGQLLQGRITAAGDRYLVTLGEKGELRIPKRDVEMHCVDIDGVYGRKRAALPAGRAGPHLDLAEWCLRHSLPTRAADELLAAIAIEPDTPRIRLLERRLQTAVSKPPPVSNAKQESSAVVSSDELDRAMRELPEGAVESFTARIQPLQMNHCSANTCHGARSESGFRLVRPPLGRSLTRRFTQRNLYAALRYVDKECPEKSELLSAANSRHGDAANVIFGERDSQQFELLSAWVKQVAAGPANRPPETVTPSSSNLLQTGYAQPATDSRTPAEADSTAVPIGVHAPSASDRRETCPDAKYAPRDPFDPETFNRRFQLRSE